MFGYLRSILENLTVQLLGQPTLPLTDYNMSDMFKLKSFQTSMLLSLPALLLLSSCATVSKITQGDNLPGNVKKGFRAVLIETDPPERKIMLNGEYVGDSPITLKLPVYDDDYKYSKIKHYYRIEAYPIAGDAQSQSRVVQLTKCDKCGDEKPFRVFLDMSLRRVKDSEVNVNINK